MMPAGGDYLGRFTADGHPVNPQPECLRLVENPILLHVFDVDHITDLSRMPLSVPASAQL